MSDDPDFEMEVVENDELDELDNSASSSKRHLHSDVEQRTTDNSDRDGTSKKDGGEASGDTVSSKRKVSGEKEVSSRLNDLPGDWQVRQIQEVGEVVGGSTPSTGNEEYWNGGIPWATPTDVTGLWGTTITQTEDMITEEGLDTASTHVLPAYSVLMTSRATIGACAVNTVPMTTNQGFQSLVPGAKLNTWYLLYRMLHEAPYLESLGAGSTFSEISKRVVEKVDIPVPPLPEQRKIASVLYTVDQAIQKTEEIIEQAKRVKRGLMQDLFHFGIESDRAFKETRIGKIPDTWSIAPLEGIVDFRNGLNFSSDQKGSGTPIVNVPNLYSSATIDPKELERIEIGRSEVNKYALEPGDIVMVRSSVDAEGVGQAALFEGYDEPVVFAGFTIRQRPDTSQVDPNYLVQYLREPEVRKRVASFAGTTALTNLSQKEIGKLGVALPSLEEQRGIADVLQIWDERIDGHEEERVQLKRLKRGLMQDLLTGEVRTADKAIEVLEEVQAHG